MSSANSTEPFLKRIRRLFETNSNNENTQITGSKRLKSSSTNSDMGQSTSSSPSLAQIARPAPTPSNSVNTYTALPIAPSTASSSTSQQIHPPTNVTAPLPPTKYERLPRVNRNNQVHITPSTSISSTSAASSVSSSASVISAASSQDVESPSPTKAWSCVVCTFENYSELMRCEMCDTPKQSVSASGEMKEETKECQICFSDVPTASIFQSQQVTCGHYFCVECSRQYLASKIESGLVLDIHCPGFQCQRRYSEGEIYAGLDVYSVERYQRFKRLQELSMDRNVIFCPSANCEVALIYSNDQPQLVCPDCHQSVCYVCKIPYHHGQTCAQYQLAQSLKTEQAKLLSMSASDRLFQKFIEKNVGHFRKCEKCGAFVEKTEGCEKMTCRCGNQFCFKCGSPGANCSCTPFNHVFYSHATVLNNWGRGTSSSGAQPSLANMLPSPFQFLIRPIPIPTIPPLNQPPPTNHHHL